MIVGASRGYVSFETRKFVPEIAALETRSQSRMITSKNVNQETLPSQNSAASVHQVADPIYDQHPKHSFLKSHRNGRGDQIYDGKYWFDGHQDIRELRI